MIRDKELNEIKSLIKVEVIVFSFNYNFGRPIERNKTGKILEKSKNEFFDFSGEMQRKKVRCES